MGGTTDRKSFRLSNLLTFCWRCNLVSVERQRQQAVDAGWVVRHGVDTEEVPVKYRGCWALLDDLGGVAYV